MSTSDLFDITRKEILGIFYQKLLGRTPDESGLNSYLGVEDPLEKIYYEIKNSPEAFSKRQKERKEKETKEKKLPISLAMFVKNNEDSVTMAINSVKDIVSEIVVLDTGSTDTTPYICEDLGALVYECAFTNFGSIRTLCARLAHQPWVLMLDSDEVILEKDHLLFRKLLDDKEADAWFLPRKRWLELEMKTQLEPEVYPDWQARLFRNVPEIKYVRRIHERLEGYKCIKKATKGPHIQHFQDAFKTGERLMFRNNLYRNLYDLDLNDGIEHKGPAVAKIDEENK